VLPPAGHFFHLNVICLSPLCVNPAIWSYGERETTSFFGSLNACHV
jgi:hypothetical protein